MGSRLALQEILETMTEHVYFQPPPNIEIAYPCIVYKLNDIKTDFANNSPYRFMKRYLVTVIDRNPDSDIPMKVAGLAACLFDRAFASKNLNHYVFNLYF